MSKAVENFSTDNGLFVPTLRQWAQYDPVKSKPGQPVRRVATGPRMAPVGEGQFFAREIF